MSVIEQIQSHPRNCARYHPLYLPFSASLLGLHAHATHHDHRLHHYYVPAPHFFKLFETRNWLKSETFLPSSKIKYLKKVRPLCSALYFRPRHFGSHSQKFACNHGHCRQRTKFAQRCQVRPSCCLPTRFQQVVISNSLWPLFVCFHDFLKQNPHLKSVSDDIETSFLLVSIDISRNVSFGKIKIKILNAIRAILQIHPYCECQIKPR